MTEPLLPRLRAAISNAYYDARNTGRTMEQAADTAAADCEEVVKAWLAQHASVLDAKRCGVCGHLIELANPNDPESYVHAEDGDWGDHTAELGAAQ